MVILVFDLQIRHERNVMDYHHSTFRRAGYEKDMTGKQASQARLILRSIIDINTPHSELHVSHPDPSLYVPIPSLPSLKNEIKTKKGVHSRESNKFDPTLGSGARSFCFTRSLNMHCSHATSCVTTVSAQTQVVFSAQFMMVVLRGLQVEEQVSV